MELVDIYYNDTEHIETVIILAERESGIVSAILTLRAYHDLHKRTFVDTETDSLSTETDSLGTGTDFCEYRNGLCGYRIVIWGVKIGRNTKNRYKLQCQAVQIGNVE